MRWKNIKLSILVVLLILNIALGVLRLGIVHSERKGRREALTAALELCGVRGIGTDGVDFSALDKAYPYYRLGATKLEEYPVISTDKKSVMLSLSQAMTTVGKNLSAQYPTKSFSLQEIERTEAGWALSYARREGDVLFLEDRAYARVDLTGALFIRYEYWEVTGSGQQSVSYDSGTLLAQALIRLDKQEMPAQALEEVFIAYKTEKEDRIAYSVPYAVFRFTLENGSSYEVFIRTGDR